MASLADLSVLTQANTLAGQYINAQTGTSYTLVLADAGALVTLTNAGAITLTVPANASVAYEVGTKVYLAAGGAGTVTVTPDGGVTINDADGLTLTTDQAGMLWKIATNTWIFVKLSGSGSASTTTVNNFIINGDFAVSQRGTSFTAATTPANNDDTYLLDQWILLSDGNDIVDVSQDTSDVPSGVLQCIALDVETANKKFGILQILEQKNAIGAIGETVAVTFAMKTAGSGKIDNVKCAIISWDGTADTVTSDIISAWGTEDTNPTLVANWTYENTPTDLNPTTSWAEYTVSATIDTASTKNIGIFIWSDVTDVDVGDFLRIAKVRMAVQSTAVTFIPEDIQMNIAKCRRYLMRFGGSAAFMIGNGAYLATTNAYTLLVLRERMRVAPSFAISGVTHLTVLVASSARPSTNVAIDASAASTDSVTLSVTTAADTAGRGCVVYITDATGWINLSAEL